MRMAELDKDKEKQEETNIYITEKDPDPKALERFKKLCWWQKNRGSK
jgi:hypothetical protein